MPLSREDWKKKSADSQALFRLCIRTCLSTSPILCGSLKVRGDTEKCRAQLEKLRQKTMQIAETMAAFAGKAIQTLLRGYSNLTVFMAPVLGRRAGTSTAAEATAGYRKEMAGQVIGSKWLTPCRRRSTGRESTMLYSRPMVARGAGFSVISARRATDRISPCAPHTPGIEVHVRIHLFHR